MIDAGMTIGEDPVACSFQPVREVDEMKRAIRRFSVLCACFLAIPAAVWSQQDEAESPYPPPSRSTEDLVIPESDQYEVHKERVGGRLERVTIRWNNGVTEVYHNRREDSLWASEETELGGAQNIRQWKVFNW